MACCGLLLIGCAEVPGHRNSTAARSDTDSIGAEGSPGRAQFSLEETPVLALHGIRGPDGYEFTAPVAAAVRLGRSRIALLNQKSARFHVIDADAGAYVATGPAASSTGNDVREIGGMCALSDSTLVLHDVRRGRVSVVDAGSWEAVRAPVISDVRRVVGCLDGGMLLVHLTATPDMGSPGGRSMEPYRLAWVDPQSDASPIIELPALPSVRRVLKLPRGIFVEAPFAAVNSYGATGDYAFVADGSARAIRTYDRAGTLVSTISLGGAERTVTADMRERYMASAEATLPRGIIDAWRPTMHNRDTFPATLPAFGAVIPGRRGEIWVEDVPLATDTPRRWTVMDVNGEVLGSIETPRPFTVLSVGDNDVAGAWHGRDGSASVHEFRIYRINRLASSTRSSSTGGRG
jgi:hypothetical protein